MGDGSPHLTAGWAGAEGKGEIQRTGPAATQTPDRTTAPMTDRTAETTTARTADTGERDTLPNTAGMLPLLALIGIGSIVGSRLLRRSRRV